MPSFMDATVTPLATGSKAEKLRVTEIFASIQGESVSMGMPTVFIRLTGCPLRCQYCDTSYAFVGGEWMGMDEVTSKVKTFGLKHVTVTGGEPLAQKTCLNLLKNLCDQGHTVSLETSGALDIGKVDPRVARVMDVKTPGSGEVVKNRWENIHYLRERDQLKFVICNRLDYVWAKNMVDEYRLLDRCEVLFSPTAIQMQPSRLAEWIVQDQLNVRFQLQLHKVLWGDVAGK